MEAKIFKTNGSESGVITLDDSIFSIEPNEHVMYLDVKQILANKRQGTHKSKQRNEVAGSTRKLKKQKGTGGARSGSIKSPLFPGGGRIFGPQVRDYSFKLNKKVKQLARKSALSAKAKTDGITILEDFSFEQPKTKNYLDILKAFSAQGKKVLIVTADQDDKVSLSVRNVGGSTYTTAAKINTYEILKANRIFLTKNAVEGISKILS